MAQSIFQYEVQYMHIAYTHRYGERSLVTTEISFPTRKLPIDLNLKFCNHFSILQSVFIMCESGDTQQSFFENSNEMIFKLYTMNIFSTLNPF